ncbi:MAG: RNA polymerase sigma factor [Bacteroidota bacterium]
MSVADLKIIEGCKKGKRHAQNKLYDKYAPVLLAICMRYARNRDEAEDILQEGFIKVFSNIGSYRGEGSFEGWLKRIMVNTAITHNKQQLKHHYHTDIDQIEETHSAADAGRDEGDTVRLAKDKLMNLIQNLPEGYRTVFNMYVFEQYTHREIAEIMEISENTSKSQLSKARRLLASRIKEITGNEKITLTE